MLLKINEHERCPKELKSFSAPEAYIAFHRRLAENELTAVCSFSETKIHNEWMENDLWGDSGFKTLHAVIETVGGRLLKIKYDDSSQAFMRKCAGGGWATMTPQDLDNPSFTDLMRLASDRGEKKEANYFQNLFEDNKKEKSQDEHDVLFDKYF